MDYFSWTELEEDISELITQTSRGESSISPGIGRVQVEYHLAPADDLLTTSPTPLLDKLMVALILNKKIAETASTPEQYLLESITQLLDMVSLSDIQSLDQNSLDQMRTVCANLPETQEAKLARLLG